MRGIIMAKRGIWICYYRKAVADDSIRWYIFCSDRGVYGLFRTMEQNNQRWIGNHSDAMDCLYFALANGRAVS
ncbi:hypothetical protein L211DRAFT_591934 [Terfezia boudieri ATCC MYA-4762]|uniref:Uncharacterized protein n=1 Tax=Terfezia boudieri ATCC MYA-4762 TaxID=1051890 RepID=A0A3N4L9T5_9PEZI|nr:hypothetical protein L211DRAFT_591934 [Terfezia boudieri ATCC MYA-4762]